MNTWHRRSISCGVAMRPLRPLSPKLVLEIQSPTPLVAIRWFRVYGDMLRYFVWAILLVRRCGVIMRDLWHVCRKCVELRHCFCTLIANTETLNPKHIGDCPLVGSTPGLWHALCNGMLCC